MAQTHHLKVRMSQRGIHKALVDLVLLRGHVVGDKYQLDRNEAERQLEMLRHEEKLLKKIIDKGGVVVVEVDNQTITTYNTEERRPISARQRGSHRARRPKGYR